MPREEHDSLMLFHTHSSQSDHIIFTNSQEIIINDKKQQNDSSDNSLSEEPAVVDIHTFNWDEKEINEYWNQTNRGQELENIQRCGVCDDDKIEWKCLVCSFSICKNCKSCKPVPVEIEMHEFIGHKEILKILPVDLSRIVFAYLQGSSSASLIVSPPSYWYDPIVNQMNPCKFFIFAFNLFLYLMSFAMGLGLIACINTQTKYLIIFLIFYGFFGLTVLIGFLRGIVIKEKHRFQFFLCLMGISLLGLFCLIILLSILTITLATQQAINSCSKITMNTSLGISIVSWIWAVCVISFVYGCICEAGARRMRGY